MGDVLAIEEEQAATLAKAPTNVRLRFQDCLWDQDIYAAVLSCSERSDRTPGRMATYLVYLGLKPSGEQVGSSPPTRPVMTLRLIRGGDDAVEPPYEGKRTVRHDQFLNN